jgi:hypothetical protein
VCRHLCAGTPLRRRILCTGRRRRRPFSDCADKLDVGDLGRGPHAHRRTPVSRPAAHIELGVAVLVEADDVRLIEPHGVLPRKELTAVCVSGELKVDAERFSFEDGLGLVRQENESPRGVSPFERAGKIGGVPLEASRA